MGIWWDIQDGGGHQELQIVSLCVCYLSVVRFEWRIFSQFRVRVFIVDIVADADELLSAVSARDEDHSDPHCVALRD